MGGGEVVGIIEKINEVYSKRGWTHSNLIPNTNLCSECTVLAWKLLQLPDMMTSRL